MRDLGTPVYSRRLFEEVFAQFPDRARIFLVRPKERRWAAALPIAITTSWKCHGRPRSPRIDRCVRTTCSIGGSLNGRSARGLAFWTSEGRRRTWGPTTSSGNGVHCPSRCGGNTSRSRVGTFPITARRIQDLPARLPCGNGCRSDRERYRSTHRSVDTVNRPTELRKLHGAGRQRDPIPARHQAEGRVLRAVATIGRQSLHIDAETLHATVDSYGISLSRRDADSILKDADGFCEPFSSTWGRIRSLFDRCVGAYQHATCIHDMNHPIRDSLKERFNAVIDGGCCSSTSSTFHKRLRTAWRCSPWADTTWRAPRPTTSWDTGFTNSARSCSTASSAVRTVLSPSA